MKKLINLIIIFCFAVGFSQNTDYANRIQHIFGNIDKTKVTTGYLKEFGIRFNEVEVYDGTIATNNFVDKTQWRSLYSSLYTMRVGMAAQNMATPATAFNTLKTQQAATSDILLAVQHYNYQQYKTDAYTNGDVTIVNEQIFDVSGKNPYDIKRVFAATPLKSNLEGDTFSFKLPSGLVYGNVGVPTQIQIDFGNGQGYQTVSYDTPISVTYTSGGEKEIKVKFVYGLKGITYYSHSKIYIDYIPSNSQARFNGLGLLFNSYAITGENWQGSTATGYVTVELAPGHSQLTKPLIVVEGFDPDNRFNYYSFINRNYGGGINVGINTNLTLNQAIENEGYDLVFINFANSTDYIQRNAYMVKEVIKWVNGIKIGNEKNVVLGMSMGGLVARYALRNMELNSEIHDTKLYVSHDAPHQGANVPLAYQAMIRHLVGEGISIPVLAGLFNIDIVDFADMIPELEDGLELLQSPAAQQMLVYQLQGIGGSISIPITTLQNNFMSEYSSMGMPQQNGIRNIAIANGSECGTPLDFSPYTTLVNINEKIDIGWVISYAYYFLTLNPTGFLTGILSTNTDFKVEFNLKSLPNQQSKQIYKGKIYIKKKVLWVINVEEHFITPRTLNSKSSMLPLDNAGGGIYDIEMFADLPSELDDYILQRKFNFIPTYSSLDISGGNQNINYSDLTKSYSPLSPPLSPKNTPFHNFYTNPIMSENHIQFTLNNGNWLLDELQGNIAFYSCGSSCSEDLNINITGLDHLCSSSTYTLANITFGRQVDWNITPSYAASITSGNGSDTVSITRNVSYNGAFTLTALVNTDCGSVTIQKNFWAGKPTLSTNFDCYNNPSHPMCGIICKTEFYTPYNTITLNVQGQTEWEATKIGNFDYYIGGNTLYIQPYQAGMIALTLRAKNACGTSSPIFFQFSVSNCKSMMLTQQQYYKVYPNPSNDMVYIGLADTENQPLAENQITGELYDLAGNLKTNVQIENNQASFSVQGLNSGIYILKINIDGNIESHNIMVE